MKLKNGTCVGDYVNVSHVCERCDKSDLWFLVRVKQSSL
jgi:hypothetical protein